MATLSLSDLTYLASLTRRAGQEIMEVYQTNFVVTDKGDEGPLTDADRRSERLIVDALVARYPGVSIVSEEAGEVTSGGADGATFYLDPLDGTRDFVKRTGEFCVMLGLSIASRAIAGVVHVPALDRTFFGSTELGGAWEQTGADLVPVAVREPEDSAPLRYTMSRESGAETEAWAQRFGGPCVVSRNGSVGLKCGLLVTGEQDVYLKLGRAGHRWDACAPEAIVRGAGGRFTTTTGEELRYGAATESRGHLAACPRVHDAILARLLATAE